MPETRMIERALLAQNDSELTRDILDTLSEHVMVLVTDDQQRVLFGNDAFCAAVDMNLPDLCGASGVRFVSEDGTDVFADNIRPAVARFGQWHGTVCCGAQGGPYFWLKCSVNGITDPDGKLSRCVFVGDDVSGLKQNNSVVQSSRAGDSLVAGEDAVQTLSHELRTPLNAILGFAEMMEHTLPPGVSHRSSLDEIRKAAQHVLSILNSEASKLHGGSAVDSDNCFNIREVIEESLGLVSYLAQSKSVTLNCSGLDDYHVRGDSLRVKQAVINLLSNGIKYNREGGELQVRCSQSGEFLRLDFVDTGFGIHEDDVERIFLPFERGQVDGIEGSGIGLSLVKQMIEAMGGEFQLSETSPMGSTFTILLSRSDKEDPNSMTSGDSEREFCVVYVEDSEMNMRLVKELMLLKGGVDFHWAETGNKGLETIRKLDPDLILLDINMPDISGFRLVEILREDERLDGIPIVALSANATRQDIERGLAAGFDDYVTKPFDVEMFLNLVDGFMKTRRQ